MKEGFIRALVSKVITKQFRRPSGLLGGKVGNMMNKANQKLYDLTLETMHPVNNESILEIGFGNGKFFQTIFSKANNLKLSGVDFSKRMVMAARKNNREPVRSGQLNLKLGNSDNLPFTDNSFDKVFCINVIYFWEEPAKHLKEIYRVLKANGKFFATIRTKEAVRHLPATKYGFILYDAQEWKEIVEQNHFKFLAAVNEQIPADQDPGKLYEHKFLCMVAEKGQDGRTK